MKKVFTLILLSGFFFACKKNVQPMQPALPPAGTQVVYGVLFYSDPAVDGSGLIFSAVGGEILLFKNEFSDSATVGQWEHYKGLLGVRARLTYKDTGETGYTPSDIPVNLQKPSRIVQVVQLIAE